MPIAGLTDVPESFFKIGQIRKGEMQEFTNERGGKYLAPVDLEYFRVTFHPTQTECAAEFLRVYGQKPTRINIRFPFKTVPQVWDANYECYSRGGLYAKAGSKENGKLYWIFYRDFTTGEVWVRNGNPVGQAGVEFMAIPIDETQPVFRYKDKKGQLQGSFLQPTGRLQVVVPEIAGLAVGYLEFRPGSTKDIAAVSRELAAIDILARQAGKDISGIPMVLSRREEQITKNIKGKLSQGESWLVHIEVTGLWGSKAITRLEQLSLPEVVDAEDVTEMPWEYDDPESFRNPAPVSEPLPVVTGVIEPEKEPEKQETVPDAPRQAQEQPTGVSAPKTIARPYPPEILPQKLAELAASIKKGYDERKEDISVDKRHAQVVASILTTTLGGDKLARHEFMKYVFGSESLTELAPESVRALEKMMGIKIKNDQGDFDQAPSELSIKEIVDAQRYYKSTLTEK